MGEESTGSFLGMGRNALVPYITESIGAAWPSYSALASVLAAVIVFAFLREPEKKRDLIICHPPDLFRRER